MDTPRPSPRTNRTRRVPSRWAHLLRGQGAGLLATLAATNALGVALNYTMSRPAARPAGYFWGRALPLTFLTLLLSTERVYSRDMGRGNSREGGGLQSLMLTRACGAGQVHVHPAQLCADDVSGRARQDRCADRARLLLARKGPLPPPPLSTRAADPTSHAPRDACESTHPSSPPLPARRRAGRRLSREPALRGGHGRCHY